MLETTVTTANPLREGLARQHKPDPAVLVLFGGSGDLARRKLMPSLYELQTSNRLPEKFAVVCFAQASPTREHYQQYVRQALDEFLPGGLDDEQWREFADRLYSICRDFRDHSGYQELRKLLARLREELGTAGNVLFYLASPPSFFPCIVEQLESAGLAAKSAKDTGWKRIAIEKPFGRDLESARSLNDLLEKAFDESDIYRVDHYLGKETVQNIFLFRFANVIFEPIWNRGYIDHVQISIVESLGVGKRGAYYEEAGALRDMVQNHCLQMLSLIAMEAPSSFEADQFRDEKAKVLQSVRRIDPVDVDRYVVRGQYGPGTVDGNRVSGYRQEPQVSPTSTTETYVAAKFFVDNWRWQDVPFYVRTGKRLFRKKTEITIRFKPAASSFLGFLQSGPPSANSLIMRIEPDEGVALRLETKQPGQEALRSVDLDFRYLFSFGVLPAAAYERLLTDCLVGDQSLFARRDAVEAEWEIVTPILRGWEASPPPGFPNYGAGSWGPPAADQLLEQDGRRWRRI